jgi:hypothetical protein
MVRNKLVIHATLVTVQNEKPQEYLYEIKIRKTKSVEYQAIPCICPFLARI